MVSISNDYDNTWVEGVAIKIFIQRLDMILKEKHNLFNWVLELTVDLLILKRANNMLLRERSNSKIMLSTEFIKVKMNRSESHNYFDFPSRRGVKSASNP